MTEKRYCIFCGSEISSDDPDVIFCPEHGGPKVSSPPISKPDATIWETDEIDSQPLSDKTAEWHPEQIVLGIYEIKGKLGQGGFGTVYRVHHKAWNIDLAVKRALIRGEKNKAVFIDEAEKWIGLGLHPNIVSCYYVRVIDGFPHTFSELAEGKSLHDWIIGNGFSLYDGELQQILKRILDIAIQFAWGLAYAHERGLVHLDVKPHNALMTPDGVLKVTDFGLAKAGARIERGQKADPKKGFVVSGSAYTRAYCSPEQAAGLRLSLKTDIWSWGMSVLEMFSGEVYWMGGQAAASALESYIHRDAGMLIPRMPEQVVSLLRSCFRMDPSDRPDNFCWIARQLINIFKQETGQDYSRMEPRAAEIRADSLNNKALTMIDLGKPDEAQKMLKEAVQVDSVHSAATYNLSLMEWRKGLIDDLAVVDRLVRLSGSSKEEWLLSYFLGLVHAERGDAEQALKLLREVQSQTEVQQLIDQLQSQEVYPGLIQTFEGHKSKVSAVAYSKDGNLAVTGSNDKTIKVWDLNTGECMQTMTGHRGQITCISFTPDEQHLITGSWDNTLKLWQLANGSCLRTYSGHTKYVNAVVVTPDCQRILSGGNDHVIKIWDLNGGTCIHTLEGHTKRIITLAISSDGQWVISGGNDKDLRLWDVKTGKCLKIIKGHKAPINMVSISTDQKYAVSGCGPYKYDDDNLWVWDIASGTCVRKLKVKDDWVMAVACSPIGTRVLSGGSGHQVQLWDMKTGSCLRTFHKTEEFINDLVFSSDGTKALSGEGTYGAGVKLAHHWNMEGIAKIRAPYFIATPSSTEAAALNENQYLEQLAYAQDAYRKQDYAETRKRIQIARTIPGYEQDSRSLEIWFELYNLCKPGALRTRWIDKSFNLHENEVYGCAISPDGKSGLSTSWDETIRMWELDTGKCLRTFRGHVNEINAVKYTPDGIFCLSCGGDETLRLWNLESGECRKVFHDHSDLVSCLDISPDGRLAISGGWSAEARLWDLKTGYCLRTYDNLHDFVSGVVFTPDGTGVIFGCGTNDDDKHTMQYWDLSSGTCKHTFHGFTESVWSVAVSPDGREVLSGTGFGKIYRWDLKTGNCIQVWEGPTAEVSTLCYTSNGLYAFSGGSDGTLRLWEMENGICVHSSATHGSSINCIAVSPNGQRLFSGSSDLTLQLWALDWELGDYQQADWDEGARPYLETFLTLHTPYSAQLPEDREPSEEEIQLVLTKQGEPTWTEADFQSLLTELGRRGYGWLREEGVRRKLQELAGERG